MESYININSLEEWSATIGIVLCSAVFFLYLIYYYSALESLKSTYDSKEKIPLTADEHIRRINESLKNYSQIVRATLFKSVVKKNSERLLYIIESSKKVILESDIDESAEKKLLEFAQYAQQVKSHLLSSVWPDTPDRLGIIADTLDTVSESIADLWQYKTNDYVY